MTNSFIRKGKKSRNELRLPVLHYVVTDQWIEALGSDAFIAFLKLHTWVDRRDEKREHDRIPFTLESTWEKLGMGKKKFYQKVMRPLWEHYLIDVVEYEDSKRHTQKPKNIIVYESPMNKRETEVQPLKKVRDWEKDYDSPSKIFGRKGGRPTNASIHNENVDNGFQTETVTVSKQKPSNVFNNLLITSNKSSNVSNNQQQQEPENKKEVVVVSADHSILICEKWEELFNESLSVKKI